MGISLGHDSGVAVLEGNKLIYAVNEERLSRVKTHSGPPKNAIQSIDSEILSQSTIYIDGLIVAPHGDYSIYTFESEFSLLSKIAQEVRIANPLLGTKIGVGVLRAIFRVLDLKDRSSLKQTVEILTSNTRVLRVEHHNAHIHSVIRQSIFTGDVSAGTFFTLDAMGEAICSKFGTFNSSDISEIDWQPALGSPAQLYAYITKVLGFTPLKHEGKLTGLAARGFGYEVFNILSKFYSFDHGKFKTRGLGYGTAAIKRLSLELQNHSREDIAAGVQLLFEHLIISYLNFHHDRGVDLSNLFCAGGAFANVKLNASIAQLPYVERLRIAPNMGDGGLALGLAASQTSGNIEYSNLFLGTSISSDTVNHGGLRRIETEDAHLFVAHALLKNKFIAFACDKMEWGPRALGNRSILFSATSPDSTSLLNRKLGRSEFMPFAPICRYEDAEDFFEFDTHIDDYLFMTIACQVKPKTIAMYPGIVHVDGSARPQILREEDSPFLYKVLTETKRVGGKCIFVNTSFNLHEEPIVANESDAIKSFKRARLDFLILNGRIFTHDN